MIGKVFYLSQLHGNQEPGSLGIFKVSTTTSIRVEMEFIKALKNIPTVVIIVHIPVIANQ